MTTCTCARVRVNDPPAVRIAVRNPGAVAVGIDESSPIVPTVEEYHGTYEVTPAQTAQVLPTDGLLAVADIVINPIPSNYGLVTWNGSTLTVS